jgi:hypothetical protein
MTDIGCVALKERLSFISVLSDKGFAIPTCCLTGEPGDTQESCIVLGAEKRGLMGTPSIVIFGLGDLGGPVLEFLARVPQTPKMETVDIKKDKGPQRMNSAIQGGSHFGLYPEIESVLQDVRDRAC